MKENNGLKYQEVKKNIIRNIDDEVFRVGELIPSERELTEMYGVSRITVRKALSQLENEGYLYRVQGKGTYVKGEQNKQNLFALTSCTQDVIRLGMTPSRRVLRAEVIIADKKRQNILTLKEGDRVFALSRVYFADDDPINYTSTYLPYRYVNDIERFDFSKASLYDVMENKYEITITKAIRTVEAAIPPEDVREYLGIERGVPLLLFKCTTYGTVHGREVPVETFKCYYRSDKFSFFINQIR